MAKHGRGLICLAMEEQQIERLGLPPMAQQNTSPFQTAFTVSIEAREGVTTGISAADRAHTIQIAISPNKRPTDISSRPVMYSLSQRGMAVFWCAPGKQKAPLISRAWPG